MDNVLSYIIMPYLPLGKCLNLRPVFGDLIWNGLKGRKLNISPREKIDGECDNLWVKMFELEVVDVHDGFHRCVSGGYCKGLRMIISDIAPLDRDYAWSLLSAMFNGRDDIIDILFEHGFELEIQMEDIIFECACARGYFRLVNYMIKNNHKYDERKAVLAACNNGHSDIVGALIGEKLPKPDNIMFDIACGSNDYTGMLRNYNCAGDTGFVLACCCGHSKIVAKLMESVDPSCYNNIAIKVARKYNHLGVIKVLVGDDRVDVCVDDNYPTCAANMNVLNSIKYTALNVVDYSSCFTN